MIFVSLASLPKVVAAWAAIAAAARVAAMLAATPAAILAPAAVAPTPTRAPAAAEAAAPPRVMCPRSPKHKRRYQLLLRSRLQRASRPCRHGPRDPMDCCGHRRRVQCRRFEVLVLHGVFTQPSPDVWIIEACAHVVEPGRGVEFCSRESVISLARATADPDIAPGVVEHRAATVPVLPVRAVVEPMPSW